MKKHRNQQKSSGFTDKSIGTNEKAWFYVKQIRTNEKAEG